MMKGILRNATFAGAVAAGTVLLAGGAAQANGPDMVSAGNNGVLNGTQLLAPVQVPIDICGNAIAVAGVAGAGCDGGASADLGDDDGWWGESATTGDDAAGFTGGHHGDGLGDMTSAGNQGVLNGTQLQTPVQVPVDVCGNAVGALVGFAGAGCDGGSDADIESARLESGTLGDMTSAGNNGVLNGTQLQTPVQVPVDVCGNAVGALVGIAGAGCDGGSDANIGEDDGWWGESATAGDDAAGFTGGHHGSDLGDMVSAGNQGVLNGTQAQIPVQVPVDFSGNGIAVLGVAGAGSTGGSSADLG